MQYSADMMACCSIMMMATITNDHKEKKNTLKTLRIFHKILSFGSQLRSSPQIDASSLPSEPKREFDAGSVPVASRSQV